MRMGSAKLPVDNGLPMRPLRALFSSDLIRSGGVWGDAAIAASAVAAARLAAATAA